jgi:hypothetical protein
MTMKTNVQVPLHRSKRGSRIALAFVATALCAAPLTQGAAASAAPAPFDTGFNPTNSGVVKYLPFAPTGTTNAREINAPLPSQKKADRLAAIFGFDKDKALSPKQYRQYMAGGGTIPKGYTKAEALKAAQLTRQSVTYLTNTTGNAYTRIIDGEEVSVTVGGYGLIVDEDGMLRVPANCPDPTSPDFSDCSPVRQINWVLAPDAICDYPDLAKSPPAGVPCGYMGAWMRANGAKDTLMELYSSAYIREAPYASKSQEAAAGDLGNDPQLIYVNKADGSTATVGVPVAPAMWITNYMLVYALNPESGAKFPAYWTGIPEEVVAAIQGSAMGQVPYSDYMSYFNR